MKQMTSKACKRVKGFATLSVVLSFASAYLLVWGSIPTRACAQAADEAIPVAQSAQAGVRVEQDDLVVLDDSTQPLSVEPTESVEAISPIATEGEGSVLTDSGVATSNEVPLVVQGSVDTLSDGSLSYTNDDGTYTFRLDVDNNATITKYDGDALYLDIPQFLGDYLVVGIGNHIVNTSTVKGAFEGNAQLERVTMPSTVTEIDKYAFKKCTSLRDIALSQALKRINVSAFESCASLQTIVIPEGATTVGDSAFSKCGALTQASLPATLTQIGARSFNACASLTRVLIPESVTAVGDSAFAGCSNLREVSFFTAGATKEPSIKTLGQSAFSGCTGITSIIVPASLASCGSGKGPFVGCINLEHVSFEKGTTGVANNLMADCPGITSIVIPEGIVKIGNSAFKNANALTQITLPSTLTTIEASAFQSCATLPGITLPSALQKIGDSAFSKCGALPSVSFPEELLEIGASAFEESGLQSVFVPENVKKLGASAFKNCHALRRVELLDGITQLNDSTFMGCERLGELVLPQSLTSIGAKAFRDCDSLKALEVSRSVKTLGNEAFYDCDGLVVFAVPHSVTSLGRSIFYDCDALVDVSLGSGLKEIPAKAFQHCDELREITLPRSVTTVGTDAFIECTNLASVYTTDALTSIAAGAFSYPKRMTIYGVAGSYAEAFANEKGIKFQPVSIEATSIELLPSEAKLRKGEKLQIRANIEPVNYTGSITWDSSDPFVATVSETGMIQAVGVGVATVRINVGSKSASLEAMVTQAVTSLSLNSKSLQLEGGQAYQLVEKVSPVDATNKEVVWSSSNEEVATVSPTGRVRGLKKGSATITCMTTDGTQKKATCAVTVTGDAYVATEVSQLESAHPCAAESASSWIYTLDGASSLSVTFDARTSVGNGTDAIAILDDGDQVVGTFGGNDLAGRTVDVPGDTVRIRLSSNGSNSSWGFKVNKVVQSGSVLDVKLNSNALSLVVGRDEALVATCNPIDAASRVVWKSSDEKVATVSAQGKVTAVKAGSATITASVGSKYDSCDATVVNPISISGASVASIPSVFFTGEEIRPQPVVSYKGAMLEEGMDYTVTYEKNVGPGTAKVVLTGTGLYTGTKTVSFTIKDKKANTLTAKVRSKAVQCAYDASKAITTASNVSVSNGVGAVSISNASTDSTAQTFVVGSVSGDVTIPKGTVPGSYPLILCVSAAGDETHKEKSVTLSYVITVAKMANTIAVGVKKNAVSCTFNPGDVIKTATNVTITNAQGTVSYANASTNSVAKRFLVDASTGKVSVPKNTAAGSYPIVIKVVAAGNDYYDAGSVTASYSIKVAKRANPLVAKARMSSVSYPYNVKSATKVGSNITVSAAQGSVTYANVSSNAAAKKIVVNATSGSVSVPKGTKAGSYALRVRVRAAGNGNYKAKDVTVGFKVSITKIANPMAVRSASKTIALSSVRKKAQVVMPLTVANARGKVTYKKTSGSARLTVNAKTGKVTIRKGTKKGTYTASILVTAAGDANHKVAKKTIKIQLRVS